MISASVVIGFSYLVAASLVVLFAVEVSHE